VKEEKMNTAEARKQIDDFEAHYHYDSTYLRELLDSSAEAFEKFNNFLPLARHKEKLNNDDFWVAKLAAMQAEDCGECLQLNVRMAREAGIAKQLIKAVLNGGNPLPAHLNDIYHYAQSVARGDTVDNALMERMKTRFEKGALLEFGLCIASASIFPAIKRAIGETKSCRLVEIDV
jgi:hypothetical protein